MIFFYIVSINDKIIGVIFILNFNIIKYLINAYKK